MNQTTTRNHRTARVSPDRPVVAGLTIALVSAIMAASYAFSFASIADAARWTGAPEWAHWLAPLFIDGAILTYTMSLAIVRWRGEPVARTLLFLSSFTGISVIVNFAHAGAAQGWDFAKFETWVGCLIGVAAPLAALFAAEESTRLVFTRDHQTAAEPEPEPEPAATHPEPEREPSNPAESADTSTMDTKTSQDIAHPTSDWHIDENGNIIHSSQEVFA